MTTLASLITTISGILDDDDYTPAILTTRINEAVEEIAAGIRMPDGMISPPLPDLFTTGTVSTSISAAYKSLPSNYQRKVFSVVDSSGDKIPFPSGGDYYSFQLLLNRLQKKDLSETGSIYICAIKGSNLYYQGIPSVSEDLTVFYYKKPTAMSGDNDEPDGLPDHLAVRLLKHYVCREIMGAEIEDADNSQGVGFKYHTARLYEALTDLVDFIGDDTQPEYYASNYEGNSDLAICD